MSARQVFVRVVIYAVVLSAIDAVSGRFFQASPDPSVVLFLGATAWVSYRLAEATQERLAFPAGVTMFVVYVAAFIVWARLLVGWNRSVPWEPRSTTWVVVVVVAAPIVAYVAKISGSAARTAAAARLESR